MTTNIHAISARQPAPASESQKQDLKLKKACQDFEAVLVNQMLSKMRQTVPKSDFFGSRQTEDLFQGMLDEEVAKDVSRSGSLKIADVLYSQLKTIETAKVSGISVDK